MKHKEFIHEPMGDKPVTAVPGIGDVIGGSLKDAGIMHLSICCPTLPLLGCIGDLPGDLTQDFPPGVGNLTVKSLMLPRVSIEMYTGFDTLARPL